MVVQLSGCFGRSSSSCGRIPDPALPVRALAACPIRYASAVAYSGTIRHCLISCPGDIPDADLTIVHQAINRWNGIYGPSFNTVVVPISWGSHAAAEFGRPPQEILNGQIVDNCDMCIAMFRTRLGTPTTNAQSGTAEEIERLGKTPGKHVGVLRSRRPIAPDYDFDQAAKLKQYLDELSTNALIMDYANDSELSDRVDAILAAAAGALRLSDQQQASTPARYAEVWPKVENLAPAPVFGMEPPFPQLYFILANIGNAPAQEVSFELEYDLLSQVLGPTTGQLGWQIDEEGERIGTLLPGEQRSFSIHRVNAGPRATCHIRWVDDRGDQSNTASVELDYSHQPPHIRGKSGGRP